MRMNSSRSSFGEPFQSWRWSTSIRAPDSIAGPRRHDRNQMMPRERYLLYNRLLFYTNRNCSSCDELGCLAFERRSAHLFFQLVARRARDFIKFARVFLANGLHHLRPNRNTAGDRVQPSSRGHPCFHLAGRSVAFGRKAAPSDRTQRCQERLVSANSGPTHSDDGRSRSKGFAAEPLQPADRSASLSRTCSPLSSISYAVPAYARGVDCALLRFVDGGLHIHVWIAGTTAEKRIDLIRKQMRIGRPVRTNHQVDRGGSGVLQPVQARR
jgi:hypothetical protein